MNTQQWNYWIIWQFLFLIFEEPHSVFSSGYTNLYPLFSTSLPNIFLVFWIIAILTSVRWYLIVVLASISSDDYWCWAPFHVLKGHLFVISGKNVKFSAHFLMGWGFFPKSVFSLSSKSDPGCPNIFTNFSPRTSPTNLFQTHHH